MNVFIVDDEPAARRILRDCCEHEPDLDVVGEFDNADDAVESIRRAPPDLVFLDIALGAKSGIDVARALDADAPEIVFVTAYDRYAIEAFDVGAIDYLLKPFDEARFRETIARVRKRRMAQPASGRRAAIAALLEQLGQRDGAAASERPRLLVDLGSRMQMVDVACIEAAEADRNYVTLRIGAEALHTRSTLYQTEDALRSQPMLRISRSCLVNLNHVREVSRTLRGDFIIVLAGGATVTSSESYRDKVRTELARFMIR
ncbi:MAG TPA: LytTR family DNA-binding domain-containing protein [Rhodanobacteraceae bacterium]|nr:LytTR family DNA-binding domain-containing protein [Rhodanobacteraceae bacterium]